MRSHMYIQHNHIVKRLAQYGATKPQALTNGDPIHVFHPSPHFLHKITLRTCPIRNHSFELPSFAVAAKLIKTWLETSCSLCKTLTILITGESTMWTSNPIMRYTTKMPYLIWLPYSDILDVHSSSDGDKRLKF